MLFLTGNVRPDNSVAQERCVASWMEYRTWSVLRGAHSIFLPWSLWLILSYRECMLRFVCRECMPIMFRREANFVGNCMEFVRSMPVTDNFGNVQSESFKLSELGRKAVRSLDALAQVWRTASVSA